MKKIKMNAAKLQLNKSRIADLNLNEMQMVQGGDDSIGVIDPIKTKTIQPPRQSVPFYITCRNCNPQTNSIGCCDAI